MKRLTFAPDANSMDSIESAADYVESKTLATGVAKTFTVPLSGDPNHPTKFVRLSGGALFYYRINAAAAIAGGDVTDGTGSISVPATVQPWFHVDDIVTISVIAPAGMVVSAEYWT